MGNAPTKEGDRLSNASDDEVMAKRREGGGGDGGRGAAPHLGISSSSQQASNNPAVAGRVRKRRRGVPTSRNAARLEFASSSDDESSYGRRSSKRAKPTTRRVDNDSANRRKKPLPIPAGGKVVIDVEQNRQIPKCAGRDCDFVDSRKPAAKEDPSELILPQAVDSSSEKLRCTQEDRLRSEGESNVTSTVEESKLRADQLASRPEETVTPQIEKLKMRVEELTKENAQCRETNRELECSQLDAKARADEDSQRAKKKIDELEGQIASQKKEHEACESARDALRSSVDSLAQTNGDQAGKIKALEQQLVGQENAYRERLTAQEKSNVNLERSKSLQQNNVELTSSVKQLKDQLVESQRQHDAERTSTKVELAKIRQDHAKELSAERSQCQHQKDEIDRLKQSLVKESSVGEKYAMLQLENSKLKDQLSSHQQQQQAIASSHSDQIAKLQAELQRERSAQSSYAELKRRSAKLEDDNERLMEELQQKEDENECRAKEYRDREKEYRNRENVLKASVGVLEAEKNGMAVRLEAERSKASRHAEEASGLRDQLRRAEEERDAAERARAREVDSLKQEYVQRIAEIKSANLKEKEALRDEIRRLEDLFR